MRKSVPRSRLCCAAMRNRSRGTSMTLGGGGGTDLVQYKLVLKDPFSRPVCESLRRHPTAYLDLIDADFDKLLSTGLIAPCNSPWTSNVVLVKRRTAPGIPARLWVTVHYRSLNARLLHRLGFPNAEESIDFRLLRRASLLHKLGLFQRLIISVCDS
jgi:hypothetical protein